MTTTVNTLSDPAPTRARIYNTLSWVIGPTVIFLGWFLMLFIARTQSPTNSIGDTTIPWVAVAALIAAIPLIIVGLAGAVLSAITLTVRGQKTLTLITLAFNGVIFAVYFGMFGLVGSIPSNGIPVTATSIAFLAPISVLVLVPPIAFFTMAWRELNPNPEPHHHHHFLSPFDNYDESDAPS